MAPCAWSWANSGSLPRPSPWVAPCYTTTWDVTIRGGDSRRDKSVRGSCLWIQPLARAPSNNHRKHQPGHETAIRAWLWLEGSRCAGHVRDSLWPITDDLRSLGGLASYPGVCTLRIHPGGPPSDHKGRPSAFPQQSLTYTHQEIGWSTEVSYAVVVPSFLTSHGSRDSSARPLRPMPIRVDSDSGA